jgi:hypothetical protein
VIGLLLSLGVEILKEFFLFLKGEPDADRTSLMSASLKEFELEITIFPFYLLGTLDRA